MGAGPSVLSVKEFVTAINDNRVAEIAGYICKEPRLATIELDCVRGNNAFHIAAIAKKADVLQTIVQAIMTSEGRRQKYHFAKDKLAKAVSKMVNKSNWKGQTPLMLACEVGSKECVLVLLEHGADPWAKDDPVLRTCLHYAAVKNHPDIISAIHTHSLRQRAPAAQQGQQQAQQQAQQQEASKLLVDEPNVSGFTPLHYAAWYGRLETIRVLADAGANLYSRHWSCVWDPDCKGVVDWSTPLHLAAHKGLRRSIKAIMAAYVALLDTTAPSERNGIVDPRSFRDANGATPFEIAQQKRNYGVLVMLNPLTALSDIFNDEAPGERAVGVPKLVQIVAEVVQATLLQQLAALSLQIQESKACQTCRAAPQPALRMNAFGRCKTLNFGNDPLPVIDEVDSMMLSSDPTGSLAISSTHHTTDGSLRQDGSLLDSATSVPARAAYMSALSDGALSESLHDSAANNTPLAHCLHANHVPADTAVLLSEKRHMHDDDIDSAQPREAAADPRTAEGSGTQLVSTTADSCSSSSSPFLPAAQEAYSNGHSLAGLQPPHADIFESRAASISPFEFQSQVCFEDDDQEQLLLRSSGVSSNGSSDDSSLGELISPSRTLRRRTEMEAVVVQEPEEAAASVRIVPIELVHAPSARQHQQQAPAGLLAHSLSMPAVSCIEGVQVASPSAPPHSRSPACLRSFQSLRLRMDSGHSHTASLDTSGSMASYGSRTQARQSVRLAMAALGEVPAAEMEGLLSAVRLHRLASGVNSSSGRTTMSMAPSNDDLMAIFAAAEGSGSFRTWSDAPSGRVQGSSGSTPQGGVSRSMTTSDRYSSNRTGASSRFSRGTEHHTTPSAPSAEPCVLDHTAAGGMEPSQDVGTAVAQLLSDVLPKDLAAAAGGALDDDDDDSCGVCLDSGDYLAIRACGHKICVDCATELVKLHQFKGAPCPFCRQLIKGFSLWSNTCGSFAAM